MTQALTRWTLFRAMANRRFALLWAGQAFSRLGDFTYQIAIAWWVLEETGSAGTMATVLIFSFAPRIVFLLAGGVAVDRFPRVPVMLIADVLRGGLVGLVGAMAFWGTLEIWQVYALNLVFGLVEAFFDPAYAAAVPDLVAEADLPSANSLTNLLTQAARIGGPGLGAVLVSQGGTAFAMGADALTFFISAAFLLPLLRGNRMPSDAQQAAESNSPLADLREGVAIVIGSPWLWVSIMMFAAANVLLAGPFSVTLPFLVKDNLGAEAGTLGLFHGAFAAGYIVGSLWLGRQARIQNRRRYVYVGLAVAGGMLALFGFSIPIVFLLAAALLNGIALEVSGLAWMNALQELVPGDRLGRVASIDLLGSLALVPLGYGLAGWATELLGAQLVFAGGGIATALLALALLRHPALRGMDGEPDALAVRVSAEWANETR